MSSSSSEYTAAKIDYIVDINNNNNHPTTTTPTTTTIAFGSCHKNKYGNPQIWDTIRNQHNDDLISFLWLGDSIYPSVRNIASIQQLQYEYDQMKQNRTSIGYTQLIQSQQSPPPQQQQHNTTNEKKVHIFGTWDDHDYGGNDRGNDMTQRMERAQLFYDFINQTIPRRFRGRGSISHSHSNQSNEINDENLPREGIYYSVEFRYPPPPPPLPPPNHHHHHHPPNPRTPTVRVIFLDTRYFRDDHCIPSVAGRFPLGAGIACLSRWFTAGLLRNYCSDHTNRTTPPTILGTEQWGWFQNQIYNTNVPVPDVLIVVSSIQVYTTNPAMESWGQYPHELRQLSELLLYATRRGSVVTVLSGDVHHGEILNPFPSLGSTEKNGYIDRTNNANSDNDDNHHQNDDTNNSPPYYLEVTSSGLTHDCSKHIYGVICEPLLKYLFYKHRYQNKQNYYIGTNYGTIQIDWEHHNISIHVHDTMTGKIVLSTGSRSLRSLNTSSVMSTTYDHDDDVTTQLLLDSILPVMDNHLVPYVYSGMILFVVTTTTILLLYYYFYRVRAAARRRTRSSIHHHHKNNKKTN